MAIFRNIQMSFWTDSDVVDDYSPEDKLFYLYVLTNPHTNLCGCYEISVRQIANEIGYSEKKIKELMSRAQDMHKTICYSDETKELLIPKWSKYNWTASEKFRKPLYKEIQAVKNTDFKSFLIDLYNGDDTVSIPYQYGSDTTVTDTDTNNNINITNRVEVIQRIIGYLNNKCNTNYKPDKKTTIQHINARLDEGYIEQDFYTVIDKKYKEWKGTEWEKYLRPDTLFCSKFESYLNQKINNQKEQETPALTMNMTLADLEAIERNGKG